MTFLFLFFFLPYDLFSICSSFSSPRSSSPSSWLGSSKVGSLDLRENFFSLIFHHHQGKFSSLLHLYASSFPLLMLYKFFLHLLLLCKFHSFRFFHFEVITFSTKLPSLYSFAHNFLWLYPNWDIFIGFKLDFLSFLLIYYLYYFAKYWVCKCPVKYLLKSKIFVSV